MGNVEDLNDAIDRRARRAVATILSFKEDECDSFLTEDTSVAFRKLILDQVNELADLAADCVKTAANDNDILNEVYMEWLEKIHDNTEAILGR